MAPTATTERVAYQPLHPDVRPQLDLEYVLLHDEVLQYCPRSETLPFDPVASRANKSPMAHGAQKVVPVGSTRDRNLDHKAHVQARIFTPDGEIPSKGWPCLVWYHGGGWVIGGLGSENGFLTHVCKYLRCVVVTVNYRHAPEFVYPAAANDSFAGYEWAVSPETAAELNIDTSRLAVGGLSAGAGLASIVGLKASQAPASVARPCFQMLLCPVIDNTATVETSWKTSQHSPWLTPTRMQWYRDNYFAGNTKATTEWTASPCFAPPEVLAGSPPTFLAVAGCDLLAPEGIAFGKQLEAVGITVETKVYEGGTHSILILAGIHKLSKSLVHDACAALAKGLGTPYDRNTSPVLGEAE